MSLSTDLMPVLYLPHGGGPLPLMDDPGHQKLTHFLQSLSVPLPKPEAIVLISAHWEAGQVTLTSASQPPLLYDYYGFPEQAYQITYPASGQPQLAEELAALLRNDNIKTRLDTERGFDHGMFIPLKLVYPEANIPCVQLSLREGLDPQEHINIGRAIAPLRKNGVLIIGSGLSFHNMQALMRPVAGNDKGNEAFHNWLLETCSRKDIPEPLREQRLIEWLQAPSAAYAHPREEHLLPLHICYGASEQPGNVIFNDTVMGKKVCGFQW